MTLVGHVEIGLDGGDPHTPGPAGLDGEDPAGDADAVRALAGKVDAAVVPPGVHASAGFAELVAEVDP